jgi:phospholipid/cholesterol/gamma-HCH transport system permease protein
MLTIREANAQIGQSTIAQARKVAASAGLIWAVLADGLRPKYWRRTIRQAFVLQFLASGVSAAGIICFLAAALGVLISVQYEAWVGKFNQSQLLAPLFVVVVVRELGPILVNIVLIARSGNAVTSELALMHVLGEVRVVEGLGLDPFVYLIIPRVFAITLASFCLTILFIAASLVGTFLCGQWIGGKVGTPIDLLNDVLSRLSFVDGLNLLLKSMVPAMLGACVCCLEGMRAGDTVDDVPRAGMRAVQRAIVLVFAVSAIISILTYLI